MIQKFSKFNKNIIQKYLTIKLLKISLINNKVKFKDYTLKSSNNSSQKLNKNNK